MNYKNYSNEHKRSKEKQKELDYAKTLYKKENEALRSVKEETLKSDAAKKLKKRKS